MSVLIVFLSVLFLSGIGYVVLRWFGAFPKNVMAVWGASYAMGVGLIAAHLYLFARLGIPWRKEFIILPWIVVLLVFVSSRTTVLSDPKAAVHLGEKFILSLPRVMSKIPKINRILLTAMALVTCYVLFEALIRPLSVWDGWAIWLLKAKIFFIDGTIHPDILNYVRSDYPLVISLLGSFVYLLLGYVDDTAVLVAFFAFYVFLALFFFAVLRERFKTTYALTVTFLLMSMQTMIRQGGRLEAGQADLALGYTMFVTTILVLEYLNNSKRHLLLLVSIFLAITGLIKSDGVPFTLVAAVFLVIHIYRKKLYDHIWILLWWLIPLLEWKLYIKLHNIRFDYASAHPFAFSLENSLRVIQKVILEFFHISSWHLLWIVYAYTFLVTNFKKHTELVMLHVFVLSQIVIYVALYLFTEGNNPESSFERLLVHVAPIALFIIAIVAWDHYKKVSSNLSRV